ncbi:hypothetical protein BT69DRAFT_1305715, partial [Atractiella rhizophila]
MNGTSFVGLTSLLELEEFSDCEEEDLQENNVSKDARKLLHYRHLLGLVYFTVDIACNSAVAISFTEICALRIKWNLQLMKTFLSSQFESHKISILLSSNLASSNPPPPPPNNPNSNDSSDYGGYVFEVPSPSSSPRLNPSRNPNRRTRWNIVETFGAGVNRQDVEGDNEQRRRREDPEGEAEIDQILAGVNVPNLSSGVLRNIARQIRDWDVTEPLSLEYPHPPRTSPLRPQRPRRRNELRDLGPTLAPDPFAASTGPARA